MESTLLISIIRAFCIGGLLCVVGQLLFDVANLTPAITMSILVTAGSILGGLGLYEKLADYAGFGAKLPIVSFGNTLTQGAIEGAKTDGFIGLFTGMMEPVSTGVVAAVVAGLFIALIFKPKG